MMMSIKKILIVLFMGMFLLLSGMSVASAIDKININTASLEELTILKNVGPKTAKAIIAYREAHKGFKTPEEITNIKGIGEKTFESNRDMIVIKDE